MGSPVHGWLPLLSPEVLLDEGYLQEANRQFFNPLGLELVARIGDTDLELWVFDHRDSPLGTLLRPVEDEEHSHARRQKMEKVSRAWEERAQRRLDRYGWIVEPIKDL